MGCDIHTFAEVKIDGTWHLYSQPDIGRWYGLFGKMAGVRDATVEPIASPKGLPEDVSVITKMEYDYWGVDGHNHSWLSEDEFDRLKDWVVEQDEDAWRVFGWTVFPTHRDYPKRLVFWFDN